MDANVLDQARAGDREAIAKVVTHHQAAVRRYMARLAPDPASADDLAQEVFLAALQSLDRVNPELGIGPYLMGIARNLARMAWRDRMKRREISGDAVFEALAAQQHETHESPDKRLAALRNCIQRLAPRAQQTIHLHYRDEWRCNEIASQIGATAGTVRSILTRARQSLRDCIRVSLGEAPA